MAVKSMKVASWVGLIGMVVVAYTGDGSAYQVAEKQPMKLAAMEGVYHGENRQGLVAFGILNPDKKSYTDNVDPFLFEIKIPGLLSVLATRDINGFVPGINDIIEGGYDMKSADGKIVKAPSAQERIESGKLAIAALSDYKTAQKEGDKAAMEEAGRRLEKYYPNFGYGYVTDMEQLIPHVPFVFYSFHIMITLAFFFIALFLLILTYISKNKLDKTKWVLWISLLSLPLGYICLESGWVVAEMGRQPWVIQDIMPTFAAVSKIQTSAVQTTFWMFAVLFTVLLVAEVGIMLKQIKKGPVQK